MENKHKHKRGKQSHNLGKQTQQDWQAGIRMTSKHKHGKQTKSSQLIIRINKR